MTSFYCCLSFLFLLSSGSVFYLNQDNLDPNPTGLEASPYTDLTAALVAITDLYVELRFTPGSDKAAYALATLGAHLSVKLLCNDNRVEATQPTIVAPMVIAEFENCHFQSSLDSNAMMVVLGSASVAGGSVRNLSIKAFILYGVLNIVGTEFTGNRDSICAAQAFGFRLHMSKATFQANSSPVGVVLLLGISSLNSDSTTDVLIEDCSFVGNGAYMGGSFMYLNVNPNIAFSQSEVNQSRSIVVRNSVFSTNPGYLCIVFQKYMNVTFSGNDYSRHDTGFLLQLFDSTFTLTTSSVHTIGRLLLSTFVAGQVTVASLKVYKVTEGSVLIFRNGASISDGFVSIIDVEMHDMTLTNTALLSASLFAFNVAIYVENIRVEGGFTYACGAGCFVFSAVMLTDPLMENITVEQGAIVAFLLSQGTMANARLLNVTLQRVSYSGVFISDVTYRNVTFAPGNSSYLQYRVMANMFVSFDSHLRIHGAYFDLPRLPSSPALYVWSTVAEFINITFPILYCKFADINSLSTVYMKNVTIGQGTADGFIVANFRCTCLFEELLVNNMVIQLSLFSAISGSTFRLKQIKFNKVKMSALAIASKSNMSLSDISLRGIEADTLFWYISSSQMEIKNLTVVDSKFDLMQYLGGKIVFSDVELRNIVVRRRFILIKNAEVEFNNLIIVNLTATMITPFCSVQQSSTLTFRNAYFSHFRSREQGLLSLTDSSLLFDNAVIEDFNVTFIFALKAEIAVIGSVVSNGGLKLMDGDSKVKVSAGFIDAVDCRIALLSSDFRDVSGTNGGVVSLQRDKKRSSIEVESCSFSLCKAEKDGGAIRAVTADVTIVASSFANNTGERGASLYFACSDNSLCHSSVSQSQFVNNTAKEGGGVKWTIVRPNFTDIIAANNTAVYGPFEASLATHMFLGNSQNSVMSGVPGVVVVEPILIAFLDIVNQTVATDDKSAAKLLSSHLIGTTYLVAQGGVANFSGVIVQTTPGTTVSVSVFSPTINATFPNSPGAYYTFTYETRKCIPGEVSSDKGCYLCPKNTFSVDPRESECRGCPHYATCPGGMSLLLEEGYWRPSEYNSDVYLCPIRGACDGGQNSTCSKGYTNRLCAGCEKGYYMAGLMYCVECELLAVRVVRISIFLTIVVIVHILVIRKSTSADSSSQSVAVLTTVKILFNFLQSMMMVSLINVDWKSVMMGLFSANEMLISFAVTSLTVDCFERKRYSGGNLKPVFLRAIVATMIPIFLILINWLILGSLSLAKRSKKSLLTGFQSSLMLLYTVHPYIVKAGIALVTCKTIESSTLWLTADVSVRCWEPEHYLFVVALFIPMLAVYIVGIPVAILVSVMRLRHSSRSYMVTFFIAGFRPVTGLWEVVIIFRKTFLILVLGLLGSSEAIIQIISAMVILYLFLEWQIRKSPFTLRFHNMLEGFSLFIQLILTGFSFYFISKLNILYEILLIISCMIMALVISFIIVSAGVIVAQITAYKRKKTKIVPEQRSEAPSFVVLAPPPSANLSGLPLNQKASDISNG